MEFKEKVFLARMKKNLSQEKFAKELNITYSTINRWENGHTKPNKMGLYTFNEWCKKNGVEFDN